MQKFISKWKAVDDTKTRLGFQVYETNDYLRYGPRKLLKDSHIENNNTKIIDSINEWEYEGGLYSPYDALFFSAVSTLMENDAQNSDYALFTGQRENRKVFIL